MYKMTGPIVDGRLRVAVLQVEGVHHQGLGQLVPVCHPARWKDFSWFCFFNTDHMVLQSKLTIIHLLGFMLKDWANSTPFISGLNSGQMKALPA